ncbi:hypothetical protein ABBQ32_004449 [Trebouxia sp. C0010 RCD-2024]
MQAMQCNCRSFVVRPSAFAVARRASLIAQGTRQGGLQCHRSVRLQRCQRACKIVAAAGGPEQQIVSDLVSSVPAQLEHVSTQLTTALFALADSAAVDPAVVTDTVSAKNGGFFGPLASVFESFLKILDQGISAAGIPYSYGFAIILLTVLVKLATYPLSKQQVESTVAMQNIAPRVKAIQEEYKGRDQQEMQIKVGQLYKEAGINPLAGCLPTLATLPVWIGLYRALSNVADEGLLTEGWFWIPSLAGPSSLASRASGGGFSWLFPFQNGAPPIGWHDAICYLVLPVALVVSQFITQKILQPPSQDESAQQTNAILKLLPLMIGYFSLNVPSGLTLYWFTNNLLTTGQQVLLKRNTKPPPLPTSGTVRKVKAEDLAPKVNKGQETSARRSPSKVEATQAPSAQASNPRGKKGSKFAQIKAQEAARKAARVAASGLAQASGAEPDSAAEGVDTAVGEATELARTGSSTKTQSKRQDPKVPDAPPSKDNRGNGAGKDKH